MSLGVQGENFPSDKITHIQEGEGGRAFRACQEEAESIRERGRDPPVFHGDVENKKGGEE